MVVGAFHPDNITSWRMVTRLCAGCGMPFLPNAPHQKYCNRDCYYPNWYNDNKERRREYMRDYRKSLRVERNNSEQLIELLLRKVDSLENKVDSLKSVPPRQYNEPMHKSPPSADFDNLLDVKTDTSSNSVETFRKRMLAVVGVKETPAQAGNTSGYSLSGQQFEVPVYEDDFADLI